MNLSTIGGLFCALGVVMGPNESTPVIQAEVVDTQTVVEASAPESATPVATQAATEVTTPVKTQHVVKFYEYEPKKRKRGLVEKLFKKLGHNTFEEDYAGTIIVEKMVPAQVQAAPAQAASTTPVATPSVSTTSAPTATSAPVSPPPVAVVTEPKEAKHGTDYQWIQGRLQRVHVRGGAWVVRYAPLDQADKHGGSVVLLRDHRLDTFKEGDFVHIDGEILEERSSAFLGGPLYRVHHIALLQAANDETNLK
jgi:hypothetical protein